MWLPLNFRARRLALGLALLMLSTASALAVTQGAPAQDSASELEAKMDELESNVDQQGDLQAPIDAQNAADQRPDRGRVRAAPQGRRRPGRARRAPGRARRGDRRAERREGAPRRGPRPPRTARSAALEDLLVEIYKSNDADTLGVVLKSASWEELLSRGRVHRPHPGTRRGGGRAGQRAARGDRGHRSPALSEIQERIKVARDEVAARRAELADAQGEIDAQHSAARRRCAPSARPTWPRSRPARTTSRRTSAPRSRARASAPR